MPENPSQPVSSLKKEKSGMKSFMVAGTKRGIQKIYDDGKVESIWSGGSVSKIIKSESQSESGESVTRWFFLSTKGIVSSTDLKTFDFRNDGLPFLTIKLYDGKNTTFEKQPAQLKDLAIHPENPNILVTATKDSVYITYDAGVS